MLLHEQPTFCINVVTDAFDRISFEMRFSVFPSDVHLYRNLYRRMIWIRWKKNSSHTLTDEKFLCLSYGFKTNSSPFAATHYFYLWYATADLWFDARKLNQIFIFELNLHNLQRDAYQILNRRRSAISFYISKVRVFCEIKPYILCKLINKGKATWNMSTNCHWKPTAKEATTAVEIPA